MTSLEIFSLQQARFVETVHDGFGQSILDQVFQPLGTELYGLSALDELIQQVVAEIAQRAAEAASLQ